MKTVFVLTVIYDLKWRQYKVQSCFTLTTHLFSGSRAVVDKHEGGEDIGGQADDGDKVGGDPGGDSSHQPFPVTLHQRLKQGTTSTAVPAGTDNNHVRTWRL